MENHIKNFIKELDDKIRKISRKEIKKVVGILDSARKKGSRIYLIGNGGSAAIASHFANDLNKTVLGHKGDKNTKRFQAICLSDNVPVLTAWANDVGYEKIFSEQLKNFAKPKDILIAISSSGNSSNIIEAVKIARKLSLAVIGFVGFAGGKLMEMADAKIFVPSFEYSIVESAHESICHLITAYFEETI